IEDDDRAVESAARELDAAGGAERLGLHDVTQTYPQLGSITEDRGDRLGLIVEAENHLVYLGHLFDQVDLIGEERPIEDRHDRFRRVEGERPQPGPLA